MEKFMKIKLWTLFLMLAFATAARAATNDLTGLLQKGLFEEEANRDLTAAIANYQSLANAFDKDRQLAATAIFRLGKCGFRRLSSRAHVCRSESQIPSPGGGSSWCWWDASSASSGYWLWKTTWAAMFLWAASIFCR